LLDANISQAVDLNNYNNTILSQNTSLNIQSSIHLNSLQDFFLSIFNSYSLLFSLNFKAFLIVILIAVLIGFLIDKYIEFPFFLSYFFGFILSIILFPFYWVLVSGFIGG